MLKLSKLRHIASLNNNLNMFKLLICPKLRMLGGYFDIMKKNNQT